MVSISVSVSNGADASSIDADEGQAERPLPPLKEIEIFWREQPSARQPARPAVPAVVAEGGDGDGRRRVLLFFGLPQLLLRLPLFY